MDMDQWHWKDIFSLSAYVSSCPVRSPRSQKSPDIHPFYTEKTLRDRTIKSSFYSNASTRPRVFIVGHSRPDVSMSVSPALAPLIMSLIPTRAQSSSRQHTRELFAYRARCFCLCLSPTSLLRELLANTADTFHQSSIHSPIDLYFFSFILVSTALARFYIIESCLSFIFASWKLFFYLSLWFG